MGRIDFTSRAGVFRFFRPSPEGRGVDVDDDRAGGASTMTRVREVSIARQGKLDAGRWKLQHVRAGS